VQVTARKARNENCKRIAKALALDHMYLPNTWLSTYHKVDKLHSLHCVSLRNGRVLGSNLVTSFKGGSSPKFKTSDNYVDVNRYLDRMSSLSFLVRVIDEYGLNEKAYKTVKRLHLVAFTCPYYHLKRMVRKATRECGYRYGKIRNPTRIIRCKRKPSLTGETKSIVNLNGIQIPLWTWKEEEQSPAWTSIQTEDEMW
jgi:hypothetical protein